MKTSVFQILFILCAPGFISCNKNISWKNYNDCIKYTTEESTFSDMFQKNYKTPINLVGTLDSVGNMVLLKDSLINDTTSLEYNNILYSAWGLDTFKSTQFEKPILICFNYSCALRKAITPQIQIIFKDTVAKEKINKLFKNIELMPFVKSVTFVKKDSSAKMLEQELGEDFVDFLGYNPLPDFIEVNFKNNITKKDVEDFEQIITTEAGVKEITNIENLRMITNITKDGQLVFLIKK